MMTFPSVGRYTRLKRTTSFDLLAGWKYLASKEYRRATHVRWHRENNALVGIEILGGVFGMGLTGIFAWFVVSALWILATTG